MVKRTPEINAGSKIRDLLDTSCIFCGYHNKTDRYWAKKSHKKYCPFYKKVGRASRLEWFLNNLNKREIHAAGYFIDLHDKEDVQCSMWAGMRDKDHEDTVDVELGPFRFLIDTTVAIRLFHLLKCDLSKWLGK